MVTNTFEIEVNIKVSIPIIGDKSIAQLVAPNGFTFEIIEFDNYENKNKLIDGNGEINYDYDNAIYEIDGIRCITVLSYNEIRTISIIVTDDYNVDNILEKIKNEIEDSVFTYFSMLHLFKEGEFARRFSFYTLSTQRGIMIENRKTTIIAADIVTVIREPFIIQQEETNEINAFLVNHINAYKVLRNAIINEFEYTYHILDSATNYKNIISSLEVLLLSGDYGSKKEMLSKRIAVFLEVNNHDIFSTYQKVKGFYVDRSEAVHDGISEKLTQTALNELRNLTRLIVKKYIAYIEKSLSINSSDIFGNIKAALITELKVIVEQKNNAGVFSD